MAEIFDAIARISWDSNLKELKQVTDEMKHQDKVLDELRTGGAKLEDQLRKTNDPAKVQQLTGELKKMQAAADNITTSQKKQLDLTEKLRRSQKDLYEQLRKTNDPASVQALLRELGKVDNQLAAMTTKAQSFGSKVSSFGSNLAMGLGIGGGMALFQTAMNAVSGFVGDATDEFREATQVANDLSRSLNNIGKGDMLIGLQREADQLAAKFNGLFDNDDIMKAQTALVNYGKVSREELSKLLPVIIELASAERIDLASATEKVVNIMEGRGGQTLRDYGLSVKGVKSEHDRLNLVLGDFYTKLQGSTAIYAQTTEGIEQKNKMLINNIKEDFGAALDSVKMRFLPFLTEILNGINYTFESVDEQFNRHVNRDAGALAGKYANDPAGIKKMEEQAMTYARLAIQYKGFADKAQARLDDALAGRRNPLDEIQARKDLDKYLEQFNKYVQKATTLRRAFNQLTQGKGDPGPMNPNAKLFDEPDDPEKAAKKKEAEERRKKAAAEKAAREKEKKDKEDAEKRKQELVKLAQKEREDSDKLTKEEIANLDKPGQDPFSQWEKKRREQLRKDEDAELSVQLVNQTLAARDTQKEITRITKEESEKRKQIARQELWDNTMALADATQSLLASEQNKTDRLIQLQEQRVEAIRDSQEKGSKESLKIEEDRLNELLAKRERYERQQRVIDAGVIVANQAVAISGAIRQIANSESFVETAANVLAIAAGITASIAAIRNASQEYQFYDGGYTGDGPAEQESTAVGRRPYKYHKREFVMDHDLTAKHKQMFEGIHQRKLKVMRASNGYFVTDTLDIDKAVSDHQQARSMSLDISGVESKLDKTNELLKQREINIYNGFDSGQFATSIAGHLNRQGLLIKMAKL
jgi:hypothetical protein